MEKMLEETEAELRKLEQKLSGSDGRPSSTDVDSVCFDAQRLAALLLPQLSESEQGFFRAQLQKIGTVDQPVVGGARHEQDQAENTKPCAGCGGTLTNASPDMPGEATVPCTFRCGAIFCTKQCRRTGGEKHKVACPPQKRKLLQKHLNEASDSW